jgi:aryl-alcohol dehydrogenase-like predicted oxidoreductase
MTYGSPEWQSWVLGEEEGMRQIKLSYDIGIQTFDTANMYSNGLSEIILGKAIRKYGLPREEIVVMTKLNGLVTRTQGEQYFGTGKNPDDYGYVNQFGLSRKHIFDAVDQSLKRLDLDYIDVLQLHRFNKTTPVPEIMQALHDVVQSGKVRYIGMSSCWAWQFSVMQNYAIHNRLTPFISMQNHYNLLYREEEREMMPTLQHFGVGSIPWAPLAGGQLTRSWSADGGQTKRGTTSQHSGMYRHSPGTKSILERVEELAAKKGVSMAQLSLAWLLTKDTVSAPIVGSTQPEKLLDLIGALDIKLTDEEVKYLEEPYQPQKILGHS